MSAIHMPEEAAFATIAPSASVAADRFSVTGLGEEAGIDPIILEAVLRANGQLLERTFIAERPGFLCDVVGITLLDKMVARPDQMTIGEMGEALRTTGADIVDRLSMEGVVSEGEHRYSRRVLPVTHPGPLHYANRHLDLIGNYCTIMDLRQDVGLEALLKTYRERTLQDFMALYSLSAYARRVRADLPQSVLCLPREIEGQEASQRLDRILPFPTMTDSIVPHIRFLRKLKQAGISLTPAELRQKLAAATEQPALYRLPNDALVMGLTKDHMALLRDLYGDAMAVPVSLPVAKSPGRLCKASPTPSEIEKPPVAVPQRAAVKLSSTGAVSPHAAPKLMDRDIRNVLGNITASFPGRYRVQDLHPLKNEGRSEHHPSYVYLNQLAKLRSVPINILIAVIRNHDGIKQEPIGVDKQNRVLVSRFAYSVVHTLAEAKLMQHIPATWCVLRDIDEDIEASARGRFKAELFKDVTYRMADSSGKKVTKQITFCDPIVAWKLTNNRSDLHT